LYQLPCVSNGVKFTERSNRGHILNCPVCQADQQQPFGEKNEFVMVQCQQCDLVWVDPMPAGEVLTEFYENYHKTGQYTRKAASKTRRAKKRIRRQGRLVMGQRFVDVGCNAGFAVEAARQLGYQALGIDIDSVAIVAAQEQFPDAEFRVQAVQDLAAEGHTFDLIYCSEVIEHLPELDSFVAALCQLMHEHSVLYLTTPDLGHFKLRWPFWQGSVLEWDAIRPPEHLFYFRRGNLARLLQQHGLSRVHFEASLQPTLKVRAQR